MDRDTPPQHFVEVSLGTRTTVAVLCASITS